MLRNFGRLATIGLFGTLLMVTSPYARAEAPSVTEEEAHAIGVEAYLYLYSLVTMDLTRLQSTNVQEVGDFKGPMNIFVNVPAYPTGRDEDRGAARISIRCIPSAWLDLTKEPMVVSVPDTDGRYYLLPMLDMWTDVFASPGWRTTGTQAGRFSGDASRLAPARSPRHHAINAPTPYVWIIGRTKTDGPPTTMRFTRYRPATKLTPSRAGAMTTDRRK